MFKSSHRIHLVLAIFSCIIIWGCNKPYSESGEAGASPLQTVMRPASHLKADSLLAVASDLFSKQKPRESLGRLYVARDLYLDVLPGAEDTTGWVALAAIFHQTGAIFSQIQPDSAAYYFQKVVDIYDSTATATPERIAAIQNDLGSISIRLGDMLAAVDHFRQSQQTGKGLGNSPDQQLMKAYAYNGLAGAHYYLGRLDSSKHYKLKVDELVPDLKASYFNEILLFYGNYAILHYEDADYDEALYYLRYTIRELEARRDTLHPKFLNNLADQYNTIAKVHLEMETVDSALYYFQASLSLKRKLVPEVHPDIATALENIGAVYAASGDYRSAQDWLKKSLTLREKAVGSNHHYLAHNYLSMGINYHRNGKYALAEQEFKRALKQLSGSPQPAYYIKTGVLKEQAILYRKWGKNVKALQSIQQALAAFALSGSADRPG